MLSKKNTLIASFLGSVGFFLIYCLHTFRICDNDTCGAAFGLFSSILIGAGFITLPIFVFTLITYYFDDRVFRAWRNFALLWILPMIYIVSVMSANHASPIGNTNGIELLFLYGIYIIAPVLIIIVQVIRFPHFKKNQKKQ